MPKRVLPQLLRALESDISTHYKPGDRYRTVREIAREQQVSLATASKAVAELSERGWINRVERDGITVRKRARPRARRQRQVAVVSRQADSRFNNAFLKGIRSVFGPEAAHPARVELHVNAELDPGSLAFGDWMLGLRADGYICLASSANSGLPFYHVLRADIPLVSDWAIETLPILPVVETDNQEHCRALAQRMVDAGKTAFLLASFFRNRGRRDERLTDHLKRLGSRLEIARCDMARPEALDQVQSFLSTKPTTKAVVSLDFETNHLLTPAMQMAGRQAPDRFFLYDCEDETFEVPMTGTILQPQAHGLSHLGRKLGEKLLHHFARGQWPAPLIERV